MPEARIIFYQDDRGSVPVLDWLQDLQRKNRKAYAKCIARIELLSEQGHELRRPAADMLRDGIYELRSRFGNVNYRILYFFHGQGVAILAHGLTKEKEISDADIKRAIERKEQFTVDSDKYTYAKE